MKNKIIVVPCACGSIEHHLVFSTWTTFPEEKDVFLCTFLETEVWYKRMWIGIKYIFGFKCKYGHFSETVIDKTNIEYLKEVINYIEN